MTDVQSTIRPPAERVLAALECSADGILLADGQGRVEYANARACAWLGQSAAHLVGRDLCELAHACLRRADGELPPELPEPDASVDVTAIGSSEPVLEWAVTPLGDGAVHTFRDVNGARAMRDATAEFAAMISHDLRLPITVALGYAQGLRKRLEGGNERDARELDAVIASSRRLNAMVTEAVDALRLQTDLIRIGHGPVDLAALAQSALTKTRRLRPDAEFALDLAEVPLTDGDQSRLEQVIVTLLANAARHGEAPRRLRVAADADWIAVEVSDGGPGMDVETVEQLIAPGRRPDGASRGAEGLGIGVTNARQIVTRMGGELTFDSAPGRGTTARVRLPIVEPVEDS